MLRLTTTMGSVALLLTWGCATQSFDGSGLCSSELGPDGVGVPDCANPSCQALEACRLLPPTPLAPIVEIAGAQAAPPIVNESPLPQPDHSPSGVPADDVPAQPAKEPETGPMQPQEPAPADTGCAGEDGCNQNQDCAGNDCSAPANSPVTDITITRIAVVVPRSIDGGETCLDSNDTCAVYSVSPFLRCSCAPNTGVEVRVDGDPLARTTMSPAGDFTNWDLQIKVKLTPQSTIAFRAFDLDEESKQEIFGCEIEAASAQLLSGTLTCTKKFATNAGLLDYSITATFSTP